MQFQWTVKAESATTVVMWIGSLLAVLIIVIWIGKNIYPKHMEVQTINDDLEKAQYELSDACNSYLLNKTFNPRTEIGRIIINRTNVCIDTDTTYQCKDLICDTHHSAIHYLHNLTFIQIQKFPNGTIQTLAIQ